ncbi:hypothetical protein [Cryobacterium melibiosiphilum]|nr:hypothetical protein [Cryobacterium melibiosiphilum]
MSAVEEIQAAIEKLTAIRRDSGLVVQCSDPEDVCFRTDDDTDADGNGFSFGVIVGIDDTDIAEGIVTLHRTIDAQLAILKDLLAEAVEGDATLGGSLQADDFIGSTSAAMMALARAINGAA